jgi:hypothetical protein
MRNLFALLLLGLLTLSYSCQSNPSKSTDATAETSEEDMSSDDMTTSGDDMAGASEDYTTTVLKSDIPSPRKEMKGTIGGATVTVNYGSPAVKGRTLWGGLVPYDQVWRAGANEATSIEVSQDVTVGGKTLAAGKYGLFVLPKDGAEWEVIFNQVADQWGAYDYDQSKDVVRVMAQPMMVDESHETMDYMIEDGKLVLYWGKLKLPIAISA